MILAKRTQHLADPGGDDGWGVHYDAVALQQHRPETIVLSVGEHEFETPPPIVDALVESARAGRHHYTPAAGIGRLRETVAHYHNRITGDDAEARHIIVVPGAQAALFLSALLTVDLGDEVVLIDPHYVTYPATFRAMGARVVTVPALAENDFEPTEADLRAAITERTRAIVVNTPNNPTGTVYRRPALEGIARVVLDHDLWLISDEVYNAFTFDGTHISPAGLPDMGVRTIVTSSLSKSHAMTGWRLGWAVVPSTMVEAAELMVGNMFFGLPAFTQDAAVVAIENCAEDTARIRQLYRERRDLMVGRLRAVPGLTVHVPEGGMFLMLGVRGLGLEGETFARRLLEAEAVGLLPGNAFGASTAGHVRVGLGAQTEVLKQAADRIARFVTAL